MRIDEFEFQDKDGNEIEPTKNQLVVYIKSLHKHIAKLKKQLKSQLTEIVEEIKATASREEEEYSSDPVLYKITSEELDTILKEYQTKK